MQQYNEIYNGGNVFASGGFGCIFRPALLCENAITKTRDNNKVSKLMLLKHAEDEYKQIQQIKTVLQKIPNYQDYFLVDGFTLCKPAKLTKEDLKQYNKKCKALTKKHIKAKNINASLDQLMSLNMPDGGINVEKFVEEHFVSSQLIRLNNALIKLLQKGIIPMNRLHIYHGDIKDANILIKNNSSDGVLTSRLIDWGLSVVHENNNGIPKRLYRRPFQYNAPFSSVLFNNELVDRYTAFLQANPDPDYFQIKEFVINYIFIWNEIRGAGHIDAINELVKKLTTMELSDIKDATVKEQIIKYDFTYYYIVEYLSKILQKYTVDGEIQLQTYFNTVFLHNIDIWGFVMVYKSIYEVLYNNLHKLNENQLVLLARLKYIIIHFLYEDPLQPISVDDLVTELTNLNPIIEKIHLQSGGKTRTKNKKTRTKNKKTKKIYT